ncbi:MAG TPA: serine kinase [Candidatus Hydrogenedentes bacterium]|nr:serine kinase [Candidatus Hydrogenedentota bacterium]HOS03256.1 serine kinase [Candidatus Hydrogenedentota bacterium]
MTVAEMADALGLENLTPEVALDPDRVVTGGHAADLLSDVLAHARPDGVLITVQVHMNVIAVSVHADQAAVIFSAGRRPDDEVRLKAIEENIPLFASDRSTFDIAGRLYSLGLRGTPM